MRKLVTAVALVALVVGSLGVGYFVGSSQEAPHRTVTETSNVYELVFKQITNCLNLGYLAPWSVTLSNGQSITAQNGNSTQCCSGSPSNPSTITFLVTNGNYSFSDTPPQLTPNAGTVTVDNQDTVVNLDLSFISCGSTSTT